MVSEETLRAATQRLVGQFHPQRVILFGSQARGSADARRSLKIAGRVRETVRSLRQEGFEIPGASPE
jgi:hypothetical protein